MTKYSVFIIWVIATAIACSDGENLVGKQLKYKAPPGDAGVLLIRELGPVTSCGRVAKVTIRSVAWSGGVRDILAIMLVSSIENSSVGELDPSENIATASGPPVVFDDDFDLAEEICQIPSERNTPQELVEQLRYLDRLFFSNAPEGAPTGSFAAASQAGFQRGGGASLKP